MSIPYTKAHGSKNDFLLTWAAAVPAGDPAAIAKAICNRHTGVGADGWLLVTPAEPGVDGGIRLINSDGSDSEMSGNGTRCAAAFLIEQGKAGHSLTIRTGAGLKQLRLLRRRGREFVFEMNMGPASYAPDEIRTALPLAGGDCDVTILNVGNPQCAVFVDDFDIDWRRIGVEIEWHSRFPRRTNVSFIRPIDEHTIDVRFWERGAGETMSSGTGSTGATFAALLRGIVTSPVQVRTPAGNLDLRLDGRDMMLVGPAETIAAGEFYWSND